MLSTKTYALTTKGLEFNPGYFAAETNSTGKFKVYALPRIEPKTVTVILPLHHSGVCKILDILFLIAYFMLTQGEMFPAQCSYSTMFKFQNKSFPLLNSYLSVRMPSPMIPGPGYWYPLNRTSLYD